MQKRTKRDIIAISIILLVVIIGFLLFYFLVLKKEATIANIYCYEESSEAMVTIDFVNEEIQINFYQRDTNDEYPKIDLENKKITLLGYYKDKDGLRTEMIFEYNFDKKTIKVFEVQCYDHTCEKVGESSNMPIICLPNRIKVEFSSEELVIIV